MPIYKWTTGSRVKADAQTVGEICEQLEKNGGLTPKSLVDASRSEDAPLHNLFEWRDEIAAEKYRESQAGYLIRSIEVVTVGTSEPVRAFMPVVIEQDSEKKSYINIERAMSSNDTRKQVLDRALSELRAFKRKYQNFKELASVFKAIDSVERS